MVSDSFTETDRYGGDVETTEPRVVARYQWDQDDDDAFCIDRATGKVVVRYDLGDPANYAPSYGGWSKREWLERKGLDPDATVDVASAVTPIPEWEVEFYRRQTARKAEVERLEAEARDLLDFIGDEAKAFDFGEYREGEADILRPALERRGFTSVRFYMGEEDSFGPLSRMCAAKDPSGAEVRFYYG